MGEWPRRYRPAWLDPAGRYTVDPDPAGEVEGWQVQPLTCVAVAAWCGGRVAVDPGGRVVVLRAGAGVAHLGDWVIRAGGGGWSVSVADGHYQRWAEVPASRGEGGDG